MQKKDGHTHTMYSHHGSQESLNRYIERAIALGFDTYAVTEHAPLPEKFLANFVGPQESRDSSAMALSELDDYQAQVAHVQEKYGNQINIKRGFEVDYLLGYEPEIKQFLKQHIDWIDEIVLSVHFLPDRYGNLMPIDYEPETLSQYFATELQTPQALFAKYFDVVKKSVGFDMELDIPVRIGHITLIRKYQKYFDLPPFDDSVHRQITELLILILEKGYELDFNAAGFSKPFNGESYPTFDIVAEAHQLGLPLVYGSDAHSVDALGLHFSEMAEFLENISVDK
ncbi:Histidinol-phosphatase [Leuconostoc pseudomesenteroides PS12]|uniref:histidinol-phosphatase HisJ n=1 Tax=Leuconostoc falkenbergense TaxID=2766470 RepID=UPI0004614BA8|nr:histidinol-phosphatase HisJ [Leuconostoc falkenbergense]KDA50115.1 Histidinol-phosphatase [Leuconostoc pseudomesenteroides PS12]OQJ74991.1 histidinol-phosphatase [Leuconostoc pseudomesenteroides]MDG9744624.1 histidinol-phosphatase HisJ [Leuconostoc falkenbergense]ORI54052.1 histidinol-phosphatase [Leuconostoc pseudomesenteroides]ORI60086.1 histidinol-phosphatase [Leuconostoc pseudomesenteroides]